MPQLTPQQIKKHRKALEIIRDGGTKKDLTISDMVVELEDKVDSSLEEIKYLASNIKEISDSEAEMANKMTKNILKDIKGTDGKQGEQGEKGEQGEQGEQGEKGADGKDGRDGRDGRDGTDGKDGIDGVDGKDADETKIIDIIEKDLPKLGEKVRDSLELLKDEERLDISAIKGVDKSQTILSDAIINRAIGIVDQRTSFLINKVSNLSDTVSRINQTPGSGSGDVSSSIASTTDNRIARFDSTTGKLIQDSIGTIADNGDFIITGTGGNATEIAITDAGGASLTSNGNYLSVDPNSGLSATPFSSGGLAMYDGTGGPEYVGIYMPETLTGNRTLSFRLNDANRTITFAGNATLSGTNTGDQTIIEKVGFTIDGGGSAITTGKVKGFVVAAYTGTITAWNLVLDAGTATVKVWKIASGTAKPTSANSINTSGVAISTGTAIRSTTLTDFTSTAVTAGDIFAFNVEAVATAVEMSFSLEITKS